MTASRAAPTGRPAGHGTGKRPPARRDAADRPPTPPGADGTRSARYGGPAAIGVLCALSLTAFTYVTTENLPIGLLSLIADDLHTSRSTVGLLVTGYGLTVAAAAIPLTRLTRRVPRRILLSALLLILVLATIATAAAPNYLVLLLGRLCTAVTQAVFWSVAPPAATALFSPRVRGRVATVLIVATSTAIVLGVPAGTWLGQQAHWRVAFLALSALGLLTLITTMVLIPGGEPERSHTTLGAAPDRRRYVVVVATTGLAITGTFTALTYIAPFLTDITGFSASAIGPLLLVRGLAGLLGAGAAAALVDRYPRPAVIVPVAVLVIASFGQYLLATSPAGAVGMVALSALALTALAAAQQSRTLQVAPGRSDVALAGNTLAFNVGIASGALIGAGLLPTAGVRSTALVAGLVTIAALAVTLAEPLIVTRKRQAPDTRHATLP